MPDNMNTEKGINYNPATPKDSIAPGRGPGGINPEKYINYALPGPDENPNADAERYRSGMEFGRNLSWEESTARRQPEVTNLATAESPQTVARALKLLKTAEDRQYIMVEDQYGIRMAGQIASSGYETFSMTNEDLLSEGIITVGVGEDGYLLPEGEIIEHGYAISVDRSVEQEFKTTFRSRYDQDPSEKDAKGKKSWEKKLVSVPVEETYFGTNDERKALAEAYRGLRDHLAIRGLLQQLWLNFEDNKSNLGGIVGPMYLGRLKFTNAQLERMFTLPDIKKITSENQENREFGDRMDLALTLFDMVGMSETKEKMEEFMSTGSYKFLVEKFGNETMSKMIGKVGSWYDANERLSIIEAPEPDGAKIKGADKAIKMEVDSKVRGDLTQFGNIYTRGTTPTDNEKAVIGLIEKLVEDPDAVNIAYRWFKVSGMVDEMGMEKYGEIPSMEEVVAYRDKHTYEEWQKYAKRILKRFSLPGEPVGSDLSKIMWPMYYRLKDYLRDRPCGPGITIDKFERIALGLLSLGRVKVDGEDQTMLKVWRGYDGKEHTKLGDIGWQKVNTSTLGLDGDNLGGLLEDEAANDSIWILYGLVNFLSGDDSGASASEKRIWPALLNEDLPQATQDDKYFTGLNKYFAIVLGILGKDIEKAKVDFWDGIRSLPSYRYTKRVEIWQGSIGAHASILQEIAHDKAVKYGFTKEKNVW